MSFRLQKYSFISSRFSTHGWEAVNHVLIPSAELNGQYAQGLRLSFFFFNARSLQVFLNTCLISIFLLGRTVQALVRAGSWCHTAS